MELTPIYKRVIGLDVHQAKISACAVAEQPDGTVTVEHCEFGAFKRDRRALADWVRAFGPDVVVMESTGIYWKSPYAALEARSASSRGSLMPATSRPCQGVRRMWAMPNGWPRWHGRVCCALRLSRRPTSVTCG